MLNKTIPPTLSLVLMSALLPPTWASNNEEVPANEDTATQQIVR